MLPRIGRFAVLSTLLAWQASAFARFDPICTTPETSVNFVSSPPLRGTLDILWSCLFTIVACTWTIQHLNLPQQRDRQRESGWEAFLWDLAGFWTSLKWMLFTMIAPEIVLGKAVGDFAEAWKLKSKVQAMKARGEIEKDAPWTLTHGFLALMGGFRVVYQEDRPVETTDSEPHGARLARSYVLRPRVLLRLRGEGILRSMPTITKAEIMDRSKSSAFVKMLAVLQVSWVLMQVISRAARGLVVSQLELAVTAFAACAVVTYGFLVSKPKDIQVALPPVEVLHRLLPLDDETEYCGKGLYFRGRWLLLTDQHRGGLDAIDLNRLTRVKNDDYQGQGPIYLAGMIAGGVIFGAIHVAGWRLDFPTPAEQMLWRICSLLITGLPLADFLATALLAMVTKGEKLKIRVRSMFFMVIPAAYLGARISLLVLSLRGLVYLPPEAYASTWASEVPYIA